MRALLVVVLLAGCVTNQPQYVWMKMGSSEQEFHIDSGQCRAQAFSVPGVSLMQSVLVYESCLQGRGWYKTRP